MAAGDAERCTWTPMPGGRRRCARHDITFGPLEVPEVCSRGLGDVEEDAVDAEAPPVGCVSSEDHERKFLEMARFAEDLAQSLATVPSGKATGESAIEIDPINPAAAANAAAKLIAEATKARRAASALAVRREDDELRRLVRKLRGGH